jgi:hypothetical protein
MKVKDTFPEIKMLRKETVWDITKARNFTISLHSEI